MHPKSDEKSPKGYTEQNRLVLFTCAAGLTGFVVAQYLGAFSKTTFTEIPPWLSAVASIFATCISAVAVILVAKTLQATRETLDATREMASDQKRIGDAQTRPYLLLAAQSVDCDHAEGVVRISVNLRNFGSTPASNVFVAIKQEGTAYEETDNEQDYTPVTVYREPHSKKFEGAVPQGADCEIKLELPAEDLDPNLIHSLQLDWNYFSHDKEQEFYGGTQIVI